MQDTHVVMITGNSILANCGIPIPYVAKRKRYQYIMLLVHKWMRMCVAAAQCDVQSLRALGKQIA